MGIVLQPAPIDAADVQLATQQLGLQTELDRARRAADQHDLGAIARRLHGRNQHRRIAGRVEHALRPAAGQVANRRDRIIAGRVDGVRGTAAASQLQPLRVEIDGDDRVGARNAAQGGGELADHALSEDGDRFVYLQLGAPDSEQRHVAEHCEGGLLVAERRRVVLDGLHRCAQLGQPLLPGEPVAAVVAERQHPVVHAVGIHPGAACLHGADHRIACRPALAVRCEQGVLFGSGAHLAPRDAHQHLAGTRLRDLERVDLDVAGDDHQTASFHRAIISQASATDAIRRTGGWGGASARGPAASRPDSRPPGGTLRP